MIRRVLVVVCAVALVPPVLGTAAAASRPRESHRVPSAQLQAMGSGAMTVTGRMVVTGMMPERARVVVIDRRGDARAYVAGRPLRFRKRRATVRDASGILFVTGSKVSVQVLGVDLNFSIAGNGRARLLGTGLYRLNGGPERGWSRRTISVSPRASESRRERRATGRSRRR